jgi:hypothetical protein
MRSYYRRRWITCGRGADAGRDWNRGERAGGAGGIEAGGIVSIRDETERSVGSRAPNAIRIPISLVRRATLYATVPYRPTQAMLSASSANRPSRTLTGRTRFSLSK